jgi:glycosyltransferase involved in cell wall biosynthesis
VLDTKYLYIKNGDAVEQLERIASNDFAVAPNGPDAFVGDFLSATRGCEIKIVSRGRRNACTRIADISATTRYGGTTRAEKLFRRIAVFLSLCRDILSDKPDRILCGSTGSQLLAAMLCSKLTRSHIVHSRHNSLMPGGGGPLRRVQRRLELISLRRVGAVVVHGPFLRDQIIACGVPEDRIFEFEVTFPGTQPDYQPPSCPTLLFAGRIEPGKGIFDLIEAAEPILRSNSRVELRFIGDGSASDELRRRIERADLNHQITFSGGMPHAALMAAMRNATVVVTPTRTEFPEGRCMVVLESLTLGVPVIAPNHGPFPYAIANESNGLLFRPDDIIDLRRCIDRVINDNLIVAQIQQGAASSGRRLREKSQTFSSAVELAFAVSKGKAR